MSRALKSAYPSPTTGHDPSFCPRERQYVGKVVDAVDRFAPALIRFLGSLDFPTTEAAWAAMQAESAAEEMQRLTRRVAEKPGLPSSVAWVAF